MEKDGKGNGNWSYIGVYKCAFVLGFGVSFII